jgi:hypothetical protein
MIGETAATASSARRSVAVLAGELQRQVAAERVAGDGDRRMPSTAISSWTTWRRRRSGRSETARRQMLGVAAVPLVQRAAMKPLGDGFIKLIKMLIAPIIFCTVVVGIAHMGDMKEVGRIGCARCSTSRSSRRSRCHRPGRRQRLQPGAG